jgi:hypothetical protein
VPTCAAEGADVSLGAGPMIPITVRWMPPGGRVLMPMRTVVRERTVVRSRRDYLG